MKDTIRTAITIEDAVALLNEALQADSAALDALVEHRVPCNATLAAHPSIQCVAEGTGFVVGLLGILNGLFGADEHGEGGIVLTYAWNIDEHRRFLVSDSAERQCVVVAEQVWTCVIEDGKPILRPDPGSPPLLCGMDESLEFDVTSPLSPGDRVTVRKIRKGH